MALDCNAPTVGPGQILGIAPSIPYRDMAATLQQFENEEWLAKGWLPLAADGCGSYYVLATQLHGAAGHPVLFIDEYDYARPTYVVASSLWSFFRFLLIGEEQLDRAVAEGFLDEHDSQLQMTKYQDLLYWPFNKERVLREDPGLSEDLGVPRPWEV